MAASVESPFLTNFRRKMRGGTQAILATASDGNDYVVKFMNNPQGKNILFNEAAGSILLESCGLRVPGWIPLRVTKSFAKNNPETWIDTGTRLREPAEGLCYGSRYLGEKSRLFEILSHSSFSHVTNRQDFWLAWMIDICAMHTDNRQALFSMSDTGNLSAAFIDHGNMFGKSSVTLQAALIASRYLDSRIYPTVPYSYLLSIQSVLRGLDADHLWHKVQNLPNEWKTSSALTAFENCLQRLSDVKFLQSTIDLLSGFNARVTEDDFRQPATGKQKPHRVLRTGVSCDRGERECSEDACDYRVRAAG
ncbi:MAG: hypothetical protein P4K83_05890 [Terracidiphilus sp.]|nr:hypothetical protein [Terracidiphilus sp.]